MPSSRVHRRAHLPLVWAFAIALPAAAGSPAGVVQDSLKRPAPPPVQTDVPSAVTPDRATPPPAAAGAMTVVVERFQFSGASRLTEEELQAAVAPFLGRPLTFEQIYEAADAVTAAYRARGLGLATAMVPAQRIVGGTVRLEVVEGVIASVGFEGNRAYSSGLLRAYTSEVQSGEVYDSAAVETAVLRLNDLPGVAARVVVQPSDQYGTSDLTFKVEDQAASYAVTLDDHGREALGKTRLLLDATWNDLTGSADQLRLALAHSEDGLLSYFGATYSMALGTGGDRIAVTANYADYSLEDPDFAAIAITGDNLNLRADYTRPLMRRRDQNLVFEAALAYAESETLFGDLETTLASTDIAWLELGLFWNRVLPNRSSFIVDLGFAGNFQSQEPAADDPDGIDSSAMQGKLTLDASYAWPFASRWTLVARLDAATSSEPLPDIQKFSVGGPYSLRGYDASIARGDYGHHLALEVQRGFHAFGGGHVAHAFVETATVGTHEHEIGALTIPGVETTLRSAGLGLTLFPEGRYSAALNYSVPMDDLDLPGEDGRFWASVTARF